jgi:hypothetical protein
VRCVDGGGSSREDGEMGVRGLVDVICPNGERNSFFFLLFI